MGVVIFGTGQLAEVMTFYLSAYTDRKVVGYTVDRAYMPPQARFLGRPVVAWDAIESQFPPETHQLIGPTSYRDNNRFRRDRYLEGKARGYGFASFIHPASHVCSQEIGENTVILEDCTVQPFARLGHGCILWSKVHIGHHARIGDNCFFASFCGIAGNSRVGDCVFFGGQTGLADNLTVGSDCIIGAGTVITENLPDGALAVARGVRVLPNGARRFARRLLG
jgi:sugar O-acyltransferase (sialic acid O-acetyltransferase NeuD family)